MVSDKQTIIIYIGSTLVGFWLSVGKILSENYRIIIMPKDDLVRKVVEKNISGPCVRIETNNEFHSKFDKYKSNLDVVNECLKREKKYGETFSMIISHDRALGRGYIINADKYPDVVRSWWPHEKKLKEKLKEFIFWEYIIDKYSPKLILAQISMKVLCLISRYNKISYLSLGGAKYGYRRMWIENEYFQNELYIKKLEKNLKNYLHSENFSSIDYVQDQNSKYHRRKLSYDYKSAFKGLADYLSVECYRRIKGTHRKNSYRFLGWAPTILRKTYSYRYFQKYGKAPEELTKYKIVYFPFHMEPEIALLSVSPEFNNSMEMIAWLSKSLPADALLVLKEQPFSFGVRSMHYYDTLRRIGNVVLAHPKILSWEWIKCSDLVCTITGTVGVEAIYFDTPVVSFGKYQIINHLPSVRYAYNYDSTNRAVKELLSLPEDDRSFKVSKEALYHSQMDVSFEVPGLEKLNKSHHLSMDLARIAIDKLKEQYKYLQL